MSSAILGHHGLLMSQVGGGTPTDPYWSSVKSLLHFEGADASTTFTDQTGRIWTPNGNAQIDTAQFKFGAASGLFDGTGDYLTTAHDADLDPTADWTIEFFFRLSALTKPNMLVTKTTGANGFRCYVWNTSGKANFDTHGGSVVALTSTTTISAGTWYHFAATRSGNDWRLFIDGNLEASTTNATYTAASTTMYIGREALQTSRDMNGWIDEFRLTKGVARYTANFTPPSAQFPDS